MARIAVLHLMNLFVESSISHIVKGVIDHLGTAQQDYTWHVAAVGRPGNNQQEFVRRGAQVVDFSEGPGGLHNVVRRIREYVEAQQIDVIHTQTPRGLLLAALVLGYDTLRGRGAQVSGRRRPASAKHLATKQLLHSPQDRRCGLPIALMDRLTLYLPDHLVTVSQKMRRQVIGYPGIAPQRVTAIPNAIDCAAYDVPAAREPCRREFGLTPELQVFGFTGRIEQMKRLDLLLEGFALVGPQYPAARLLLIGEGALRPALEAQAARLGIASAVIWAGFRRDIPRLLAALDVYVQSSANEGLSLSILEAMAAGKPVIATEVGGVAEAITDGQTGLLIPFGAPSAIGAAMGDLLAHPAKRAALGEAARRRVTEQYDISQLAAAYGRLYQALAGQP